ncbi:MAG: hypothetical protein WC934_08910 [Acidithiobacillus sp.]|uniref:hypothetical protein n=1 Tax=Acidithiobacillus sp. TaxID=1872118 RepID=UPI00355F28D7
MAGLQDRWRVPGHTLSVIRPVPGFVVKCPAYILRSLTVLSQGFVGVSARDFRLVAEGG